MASANGTIHSFVAGGGIKVAVGASTVEITSLKIGAVYQLSAVGGDALVRVGASDAASSNGNFDFIVNEYDQMHWKAPSTTINVIEADTTSDAAAALYISEIADDVI